MISTYPAFFFKEKNGYSVIFPDLNYLATQGDTIDEAFKYAIECLAGYLYVSKINGDNIPKHSDIKDLDPELYAKELDLKTNECFVNYVSVDVDEYARLNFEKPIKKTLTIPKWLNEEAINQGINFSKVLQDALLNILHPQHQ